MPRDTRLDVRKTYKLYIGGKFPRSESGRSYVVNDSRGRFLANAAAASRKDARDAVVAARKAFPGWSGATAYNRGQVLYRVAEVMEGRRDQFIGEVAAGEGVTRARAGRSVDQSIDRLVWYAGWTDKIAQVVGATNPVAGPYFDFSIPEPTGVVAALAPQQSSLLGLVSVVAPVVAGGNTAVVASSRDRPLPAISFAEVLATSDVPGGVVNILTGSGRRHRPVARLAHGRQRPRPHRRCRRRRARHLARGCRRRQPQARSPCSRRRARLDARPWPRPHHELPGDQDGLAPHRRLTIPLTRHKMKR
ncbi:MAG: aldehyde dehydrogenase family protein [Nocardioidaceae bacterium]